MNTENDILTRYAPRNKAWRHAVAWLLFIAYEQGTFYFLTNNLGNIPEFIYHYLINIGVFYTHLWVLNQSVRRLRIQYKVLIPLFLSEILLCGILKTGGELLFNHGYQTFLAAPVLFRKNIILDLLRAIYYIGMATLYWAAGHLAEFRRISAESRVKQLDLAIDNMLLESKLANARNAYLKQQLNPHLLFNTLNFIYSSVYASSENGGKAVLLLAEIMRFSLQETDANGKIPLHTELIHLEKLVALNRFRYHFPLDIRFDINGDPDGFDIIPIVLLTLTENMFKHGDFQDHSASIIIDIPADGQFRFRSRNAKKQPGPGTGIGLHNTRQRLGYTYPNQYILEVKETELEFRIDLTIQL